MTEFEYEIYKSHSQTDILHKGKIIRLLIDVIISIKSGCQLFSFEAGSVTQAALTD